jgi:hypothetical protein
VHGTRSNTINSANAIARIGGADVFIHFGVLNGTPNWNTWIQPFRPSDDYPFGLLLCPAGGYVGIGTSTPGYRLTVNGTAWCSAGAWTGSDLRWKENFLPLSNVMPDIQSLMPVSYDLKIDEFPHMGFEDGRQIGLIAQDVEKIFPELVRTDNNGFKSVSYEKLSVVLLEAIKEQQQQIETQNQKIDQLIVLIEGLKGEIASSLRSSQ